MLHFSLHSRFSLSFGLISRFSNKAHVLARYRFLSSSTRHHSSTHPQAPQAPQHRPTDSFTCWKCNHGLNPEDVVCSAPACRTIQPVRNLDFFKVFVGKPTFQIQTAQLRRRYLDLQQKCHPDNWSTTGSSDDVAQPSSQWEWDTLLLQKQYADAQSSWINKAYHTLKDPLHRATYILQLQGCPVSEEDQVSDPLFLTDVLETRERIDSLASAVDLEAMMQQNQDRIHQLVSEMTPVFEELVQGHGHQEVVAAAKQFVVRLKYMYGIDAACRQAVAEK